VPDDKILFNDGHSIEAFRGTIMPTFRDGLDVAIARYRGDELMGGVVFTDYYYHHSISVHAHSWNPRWLNRDLLYVIFDYPFNQLKVKHLFASAREDKTSFDLNIGFRIVARVEHFYPDTAKVWMRMDREDCRYLDVKPRNISSLH
jgi:hypothetical protein